MPNSLTRQAGLRLGPIMLETLVKHYFDRIKKKNFQDGKMTKLRQDELLYDEAFNIVKKFLNAAAYHSVEEVQAFSNTNVPISPWVRVVRLVIPRSCCDEAAIYLVQALGGEDVARRIVGGVKWWQVRGVNGVDAEWITMKKDWREAKKRHKAHEERRTNLKHDGLPEGPKDGSLPDQPAPTGPDSYDQDMDEMRCILYAHGGGYYFGSADQERYSIQRHARKLGGRAFAVNYRLAPQYPFPCALQDLLAAYLFLIRPPPDASHRPVNPAYIVIAGDSAGGGLSLALLQIIRDVGLPMPAGGVLISPWCDLTHSFLSIHTNTATDVIPVFGLSMQKPSPLWPPPSYELTQRVHTGLRSRIREMVGLNNNVDQDDHTGPQSNVSIQWKPGSKLTLNEPGESPEPSNLPIDMGTTTPLPLIDAKEQQRITLIAKSGETLIIDQQVHMYAQNSLLGHPLVSPALSYLGGLPPLLFIAGDREVLRDEIIYAAHKAANPSEFPLSENARKLYPPLVGIEERYGPTAVHLQVYDDAAHVLPVLFSFTTPGKFCYRAIASFCKHVTGMPVFPPSSEQTPVSSSSMSISSAMKSSATSNSLSAHAPVKSPKPMSLLSRTFSVGSFARRIRPRHTTPFPSSQSPAKASTPRSFSSMASFNHIDTAVLSNSESSMSQVMSPVGESSSQDISDVGASRVSGRSTRYSEAQRFAGEPSVYVTENDESWKSGIIRERVSTRGLIRPLEPQQELDAFRIPPEAIGALSELAVRRYIDGKAKFDKKFASDIRHIERQRLHTLELARKDIVRNMSQLQGTTSQEKEEPERSRDTVSHSIQEGLKDVSGSWSWAWALDLNENPPPSSIVSRRDTEEARRLARIADQAFLSEDGQLSGNSLWSLVVNFLTPDKSRSLPAEFTSLSSSEKERKGSKFSPFRSHRKEQPSAASGNSDTVSD